MIIDKTKYIKNADRDDLVETIQALLSDQMLDSVEDGHLKDLTEYLIDLCDELDCEDAFGTEGWRHLLGLE